MCCVRISLLPPFQVFQSEDDEFDADESVEDEDVISSEPENV